MLQLSPEGQQVALERVDELTQLQKYKRNTQDPSMSDEKASMLAKMVSDYADKDISEDDLAIIKHFQDHQKAPHPIKNSDT